MALSRVSQVTLRIFLLDTQLRQTGAHKLSHVNGVPGGPVVDHVVPVPELREEGSSESEVRPSSYPGEGGEVGPVHQDHSHRLAVLLHPGLHSRALPGSCHRGGEPVGQRLDRELRVEVGGDGDGEGGSVLCRRAAEERRHSRKLLPIFVREQSSGKYRPFLL